MKIWILTPFSRNIIAASRLHRQYANSNFTQLDLPLRTKWVFVHCALILRGSFQCLTWRENNLIVSDDDRANRAFRTSSVRFNKRHTCNDCIISVSIWNFSLSRAFCSRWIWTWNAEFESAFRVIVFLNTGSYFTMNSKLWRFPSQ